MFQGPLLDVFLAVQVHLVDGQFETIIVRGYLAINSQPLARPRIDEQEADEHTVAHVFGKRIARRQGGVETESRLGNCRHVARTTGQQ